MPDTSRTSPAPPEQTRGATQAAKGTCSHPGAERFQLATQITGEAPKACGYNVIAHFRCEIRHRSAEKRGWRMKTGSPNPAGPDQREATRRPLRRTYKYDPYNNAICSIDLPASSQGFWRAVVWAHAAHPQLSLLNPPSTGSKTMSARHRTLSQRG
jgi:hypothetical protein